MHSWLNRMQLLQRPSCEVSNPEQRIYKSKRSLVCKKINNSEVGKSDPPCAFYNIGKRLRCVVLEQRLGRRHAEEVQTEEEQHTSRVVVAGMHREEEEGGTVPVEDAASGALRPFRSWMEDIGRQENLTEAVFGGKNDVRLQCKLRTGRMERTEYVECRYSG